MIGKVTVFTHVITLTAVSMPDHMKCALSEFGNGSSVSFTYYTKKTHYNLKDEDQTNNIL